MAVFIVTYDLNKEANRPKIVPKIKDISGVWAKLSESSYAVATDKSAGDVFNFLKPLLDDNDQLYVITLKKPYAGRGSKEVNDWLENNPTY